MRLKRSPLLACGVLAAFYWPALAQTTPDPGAIPFADTTEGMRQTAHRELQAADAKLNSVYKILLGRLSDKAHIAKLRNAQRAWIKYRDANCDFEAWFYDGGSIKMQIQTYCRARITLDRAKELQAVLDNEFDR